MYVYIKCDECGEDITKITHVMTGSDPYHPLMDEDLHYCEDCMQKARNGELDDDQVEIDGVDIENSEMAQEVAEILKDTNEEDDPAISEFIHTIETGAVHENDVHVLVNSPEDLAFIGEGISEALEEAGYRVVAIDTEEYGFVNGIAFRKTEYVESHMHEISIP